MLQLSICDTTERLLRQYWFTILGTNCFVNLKDWIALPLQFQGPKWWFAYLLYLEHAYGLQWLLFYFYFFSFWLVRSLISLEWTQQRVYPTLRYFSFLFFSFPFCFGVKLDLGVLGFSLSSFMLNHNVSGSKLLILFLIFFQVAQHGRLYGTNGMPSIGPFTCLIFFLQ